MREEIGNARNSQSIVTMNQTLASISTVMKQIADHPGPVTVIDPEIVQSIGSLNATIVERNEILRRQNCALLALGAEAAGHADSERRRRDMRARQNILQSGASRLVGESGKAFEKRRAEEATDVATRKAGLGAIGQACAA
jgi:uncharacterized protein (UPF0371 family)